MAWLLVGGGFDYDGGVVLFLEMAEGGKGLRPMKPVPS